MGIFDRAKDLAREHSDKVEGATEKAADVIDEKTGGKHSEQIEKGKEAVNDFLGGGDEEQQQ